MTLLSQSVRFQQVKDRVTALEGSPTFTGDNLTVVENFGLHHDAENPYFIFDVGDSFGFARSANLYGFNIAGSTVVYFTPTGFHIDLALLPIAADNTAAIAAGCGQGALYRKATGELLVRY